MLRAFDKGEPPIHHHWGIPLFGSSQAESSLDDDWVKTYVLGLIWEFDIPAQRRLGLFPSWSWIGWGGWRHIKTPMDQFEQRRKGTFGWDVDLQVGVQSLDDASVEWVSSDSINLSSLASSSIYIHITSRTTTLGELKREFSKHSDDFFRLSITGSTQPDDTCRAIFLTAWSTHAIFLLVAKAGIHFERLGMCRVGSHWNNFHFFALSAQTFLGPETVETIVLG